jgi:ADP-ribose pyrophosphatase YjhB (NUDIX family)
MKYCCQCGNAVSLRIPRGDDRHRIVCDQCEWVHYENPRMIVCTVPCYEDQVLLCKRSIEPRWGLWTVPGGFMENGETLQNGALRETTEEAGARVSLDSLYAIYNLPHIDQVHFFFLGKLLDVDFQAGKESLEVALFREAEVPWQQIAFPAVTNVLRHYFRDRQQACYPLRINDVQVSADGYDIKLF